MSLNINTGSNKKNEKEIIVQTRVKGDKCNNESTLNPIADIEDFIGDFDIHVPLQIKQTFKIKVKVRSVKKFSPIPFLD